MPKTIEGIVRGGRIELIDGPELADGLRVRVLLETEAGAAAPSPVGAAPEEGVIHTPATPELLELLDQIRRTRRLLPPSPSGPGRKSAAGMLAGATDFDAVMEEIERERQADHGGWLWLACQPRRSGRGDSGIEDRGSQANHSHPPGRVP